MNVCVSLHVHANKAKIGEIGTGGFQYQRNGGDAATILICKIFKGVLQNVKWMPELHKNVYSIIVRTHDLQDVQISGKSIVCLTVEYNKEVLQFLHF